MTSPLPKVTPHVLKRRAAAFDNPNCLYELKYDGFRALLEIDGSGARPVSRNRNRFRHLDPLAAALAKRLRVSDAILDGEVIASMRRAGQSASRCCGVAIPCASSHSICYGSMAMICHPAVEEHDLEGIVAKRKNDPTGAV